jgi:hypothetical protein
MRQSVRPGTDSHKRADGYKNRQRIETSPCNASNPLPMTTFCDACGAGYAGNGGEHGRGKLTRVALQLERS